MSAGSEALQSPAAVADVLGGTGYLCDEALATITFLGLRMQRPLLLEGEPGTGKTTLAEAMATALPVVATRHSGIPEQVLDGETGILVAEGDVAGMGAAIARLLADPGLAARMGAAGRARALERLDQSRLLDELRSILGIAT